MKNVIYYNNIELIGGVSSYEYELAFKYYQTKDITLYYSKGNISQVKRLRKYIRVIKWSGEDVECDNFLTNYGFEEFIPHVKLSGIGHTYQTIHAMYKTNKIQPKVDDFFDYYICVSDIVKKEFQEVTGLPDDKLLVSHNPLTITEEDKKPCLMIGSFQRLRYAWEKGEKRMSALIQKLDNAHINYLWLIASDYHPFKSENVIYIEPRVEVRNIMATCDVVTVLSDCEGDNYVSKEAKSVGCKILSTPLESLYENEIIGKQDKTMEFDMSNIDEVVEWLAKLYESKPIRKSDYVPPIDHYDEILLDGISNYAKELSEMNRVRVTSAGGLIVNRLDTVIACGCEVELTDKEYESAMNQNAVEDVVKVAIRQVPTKKATRKNNGKK